MEQCPTGKKILDKKGALSMKNLTMELHHIKMEIYQCKDGCNGWHLTTIADNKKKRFKNYPREEVLKRLKKTWRS